MRVGITGHRPKGLPGGYDIRHESNVKIRRWLVRRLQESHADEACSGMALGVDQYFVAACLICDIPFDAFLPCRGQSRTWPPESQKLYKLLCQRARSIRYTVNGPYPGPGCMVQRNQEMVDWLAEQPGSLLLAVWNGIRSGGTWDCMQRAFQADSELHVVRYDTVVETTRRYARGWIAAVPDSRHELEEQGAILGPYDNTAGHFVQCAVDEAAMLAVESSAGRFVWGLT